jgi:hypothetical protein
MTPKIYFFSPIRLPDGATQNIDQLAIWQTGRKQRNIGFSHWVLQTFVYLKEYGFECDLVEPFPEEGIILAHRDTLPTMLKPGPKRLLVCLQADRSPHPHAQLSIVHNPCDARVNMKQAFYIPPWPQIGIIPRSKSRGARFKTIAYIGWEHNLAAELRSPLWQEALSHLGLELLQVTGDERSNWNDYSQVDAILAVRGFSRNDYYDKPALKLFNAWHAGVPAILGAESAYRAERVSELDYIEVMSVDETLLALKLLAGNKQLREEIINNGWMRAKETRPEIIASRWIEFFTEIAIPAYYRFRSR